MNPVAPFKALIDQPDAVMSLQLDITAAIARLVRASGVNPQDAFGVALTALSISTAHMIFAGATSKRHGLDLLDVHNALVRERWNDLAAKEPNT